MVTTEPDRPRRDVSIEEAERMAMSEEELLDIERHVCDFEWHPKTERIIVALVAEVRRLREERRQHWNRWDPTNASDAT